MDQPSPTFMRPIVNLDVGGDYDEWWKDVSSTLRKKGLQIYCWSEPEYLAHSQKAHREERQIEASLIICNQVAPSLLLRVPLEDRFNPRRLPEQLVMFCKPFPIMDLPCEVRLRVYEMNFNVSAPDPFRAIDKFSSRIGATTSALPNLTKTCRHVRQESLRHFISSTTLEFFLPLCEDEAQALDNMRMIRLWGENCAKAYVRHIRAVKLMVFDEYNDFSCYLSFTERGGLRTILNNEKPRDCSDKKAEAKRKQLQEHAEEIEKERRVLDLKGESIVLAMIRNPEVWFWGDTEEDSD